MLKRTAVSCVLWSSVIAVATALLISSLAYYYVYYEVSKAERTIIISQNSDLITVSRNLFAEHIITNRIVFFIFAKIYTASYGTIKAGEYTIPAGSNMIALLERVTKGITKMRKITIPEGYTMTQVIQLLIDSDGLMKDINEHEFAAEFPEGSILPETYHYTYGSSSIALLKKMKANLMHFIDAAWGNRDKKIDKPLGESKMNVLILASIVEKESSASAEKPRIASVYLNRLKNKMRLQADPTVIYGIIEGKRPFSRKVKFFDLKHQSQYNTYINLGLPPTPICNPGKEAILAVLNPLWTKDMFFVANGCGRHLFSQNFASHKQNIRSVRGICDDGIKVSE